MSFRNLNVLEWGVLPDMPFEQSRKTRLVNVFTLLASGTTLPYIYIFFREDAALGLFVLANCLALMATWLFNRSGKYHFAKIWLYLVSYVYLFTASSALGEGSGEYLYLIPVLFGAVLLFEFKERYSLIVVVCLNFLTFLGLEVTDYGTFDTILSTSEQQWFYNYNFLVTLLMTMIIAAIYFYLYNDQLKKNRSMLETSHEIERTINYFSTSTFGKNSVDEILWDVTKNCVSRLGLVDCVIYLLDENRQCLVQKAAYGPKNPRDFEILQPLDIPLGKGIVGHVAKTGKAVLVNDTSDDARYLKDNQPGLSEIAVPLLHDEKVIGVIDSEHPEKNFFTDKDLGVLKTISALCANKVAYTIAEQERENALKVRMEAEKIKSLDELKNKLFANVSHELRTPLTLINGTIDHNLKKSPSDDWKLLKKHTDRLLSLINQILDLTKLESGQFRLRPVPNETTSFLRQKSALFESVASLRDITIHYELPKKDLWLNFDVDAMEKILFNLLSNALKFSKKHTNVVLKTEYKNGKLRLSISNQGPRIPLEEQKKIFDRYYQANTTSQGGTGIGLALTKELVELHKGKITLESELGSGTTFFVTLPLETALPQALIKNPTDEIVKKIENQGHRHPNGDVGETQCEKAVVLIVEDNLELVDFINKILVDEYKVMTALDGEEGVRMAKEFLPDLVLSDVMMPIKDGIALSNELKQDELTSHIPIILLTAKADLDSKLVGLRTGADDYMVKPFNANELLTRTANLICQRKKLREKYCRTITLGSDDVVVIDIEEVFMQKLMTLIERNLDNSELSIKHICREMGVSRMQLHRKLNALTGQSASTFIRLQRLHYATKFLEAGESVSQVAYSVGFSSLSYFSKAFKAHFGVSPSEYSVQET